MSIVDCRVSVLILAERSIGVVTGIKKSDRRING